MKKRRKRLKKLEALEATDKYEVYYQDECHFKNSLTLMRAWFPKGDTPVIKDPGRHEKLSVFGAYNKNEDRIIMTTYFNAVAFKRLINHLLERVKLKEKKIPLIVDNARYHRAKELKDFFCQIKDKLELLFLPPYSPNLNLIETEWRETRRNATHNRCFATDKLKRQALFDYWNKKKNKKKEMYLPYLIKTFIIH